MDSFTLNHDAATLFRIDCLTTRSLDIYTHDKIEKPTPSRYKLIITLSSSKYKDVGVICDLLLQYLRNLCDSPISVSGNKQQMSGAISKRYLANLLPHVFLFDLKSAFYSLEAPI